MSMNKFSFFLLLVLLMSMNKFIFEFKNFFKVFIFEFKNFFKVFIF